MARLRTPTADSLAGQTAREIRAEMGRQGVSQETLAVRLGWTQRSLSRRLTGDVAVDMSELERIAEALAVPVARLIPAEVTE